jgi:hypothetical protein
MSKEHVNSIFDPEDGASIFLQNVSVNLLDCKAGNPGRW